MFIPFGKFFHVLQRPASVGIQLYSEIGARQESVACARCGEPLASQMFTHDLRATLDELGQDYRLPAGADAEHLTGLCPRCKRVARGQAYFAANGPSFALAAPDPAPSAAATSETT